MKHPHAESQHLQAPVICAVDASEEGEAVVCAGARLAALTGAALVLFHVARGEGRWHGLDRLLHADRQASDRAEAYALLLEERAAGVPVVATLELSTGFPTEEVLLAAEDMDPALLVMGSRGQGALQTLFGSVSREVTKDTSRPDAHRPRRGRHQAARRRGGALRRRRLRPEPPGGASGRRTRLRIRQRTDRPVRACRDPAAAPAAMPAVPEPPDVSPESEDALRARAERVAERLRAIAPVRVIVDVGDPATRLSLVAEEFDAALIAVGSVHRSLLASAVTGSVASARIRESSHPVLLVP
jgi:nucleotide-binding universal stress UspA family protein